MSMTKPRKPAVEEAKQPDKARVKPVRAPEEEDDLLGTDLLGKRRLRILRDFEIEEEDEEDELLKQRAPARRKVRAPDEDRVEEKVLERRPKPGAGKKARPAPAPAERPGKRERRPESSAVHAPEKPAEKMLVLPASISVRDLAARMGISPIDVIKELMNNGVMANINQMIDFDTAAIVASELGFSPVEEKPAEPEVVEEKAPEKAKPLWKLICEREDPSKLKPRPPVVTVLGHVDHGKTTLLDAIRHANVAASEAGGITQRIGAYQVEVHGKKITFIDTPGHEAFTAMRARGAQVTDLAVLVVAADDGVMPQTREAINHARAAQVPILVALNKIDKPNANPERVKQQLADEGLVVEDWGGDVICVPISAKLGQGIEDLLENILLVTEVAELKANPDCPAMGTVLESKIDKARGPIATLLVQNGTLRVGDNVVAGEVYGRVRAMFDDRGNLVKEAPPSMPVAVLGLAGLPTPGDLFEVVPTEREAKAIAEERARQREAAAARAARRVLTLEDIASRIKAGQAKELNIILKADVQGAIEPIVKSLERLGDEELRVKILHTGTGNISESDVMLAAASDAIVVGFGVQVDQAARRLAEQEGVDIRLYNVIYMLLEDMEKALKGMLEPKFEEKVIGHAEVRAVFKVSKLGQVAGCYVMDGVVHATPRCACTAEMRSCSTAGWPR